METLLQYITGHSEFIEKPNCLFEMDTALHLTIPFKKNPKISSNNCRILGTTLRQDRATVYCTELWLWMGSAPSNNWDSGSKINIMSNSMSFMWKQHILNAFNLARELINWVIWRVYSLAKMYFFPISPRKSHLTRAIRFLLFGSQWCETTHKYLPINLLISSRLSPSHIEEHSLGQQYRRRQILTSHGGGVIILKGQLGTHISFPQHSKIGDSQGADRVPTQAQFSPGLRHTCVNHDSHSTYMV